MGWFDEQIKTRVNNDKENFENAFINLSSVVMGRSVLAAAMQNDRQKAQNAIEEILKFYHVKKTELPETITDLEEILEYLLRPSGIMRRSVSLTGDWYKDGIGALLGHTVDGEVIALIPDAFSGYQFYDYKQGKNVKVTARNKDQIAEEAICFYKPLPLKKLGIPCEVRIISAHRTPEEAAVFSGNARENGFGAIIAAAGKAAHLAGAMAANTTLPVIGIPIKSSTLDGLDALLATVQMPSGMPVATVAIDGAQNAALLAAQMLAIEDEDLAKKLKDMREDMTNKVLAKDRKLQEELDRILAE